MTSNVFSAVSGSIGHLGGRNYASGFRFVPDRRRNAGLPKVLAESFAAKFSVATPKAGESLLDVASRIVSDNIAYIVVFLADICYNTYSREFFNQLADRVDSVYYTSIFSIASSDSFLVY